MSNTFGNFKKKDSSNKNLRSTQVQQASTLEEMQEQLGAVQGNLIHIIEQFNKSFEKVRETLKEQEEVISAIAQLVGTQEVTRKVVHNREDTLNREAQAKVQGIRAGVETGKLVVSEVVSEKSIVIAREVTPGGIVTVPSENVFAVIGLNDEFINLLSGKKTGESVEIPGANGNVLTLLEIFDMVSPSLSETTSETQETVSH